MPRKPRVQYPGAIFHLMSRGDRRENIFLTDIDRHDFIKTLAEACEKTGWQVHAFCLMANHFHLVVETPNANLVEGMKWLLSTYTIRLNHRHKLFGHVFSGRYKALVLDGSATGYLRTACDYVHLNPVRATLLAPTDPLLAYPWSSFPLYLAAPQHRPGWLRTDRLLGEHGIEHDDSAGARAQSSTQVRPAEIGGGVASAERNHINHQEDRRTAGIGNAPERQRAAAGMEPKRETGNSETINRDMKHPEHQYV